ncbi:uncharacterized protein LOC132705235 [Cylas formicarius]|uniref:uncharacterized protein LOC132705235 n=1 Tax=Cylas formicarius TaxID=197179 RepID=UPI002958D453|nr:uncharacterized protein LOC132705235 [Cylas formicarius]
MKVHETMISNLILFLILFDASLTLPQGFQLPTLTNFPPPEEVHALKEHNQQQRSIARSVEIQKTEETVKEVEELIKSNPALPRLTKGEILDILENITREDGKKITEDINDRDPKAIMVVKAYTPLGSGEVNFEDLYTKPPVTNIVESEKDNVEDGSTTKANITYFRRKPTKDSGEKKVASTEKRKPYRGNTQFKTSTTTTRRPFSTVSRSTITPTTRKEIKRRRRPPVTSQPSPTTYNPRRRVPTTTKHPNHKYPEEPSLQSSEGLRIIDAPKFKPSEINYELVDLEPQEGGQKESVLKPELVDLNKQLPPMEVEIPDHLKKVVNDLNLAGINDPESFTITAIRPTSNNADAEKIKDILASIGVIPLSTTTSTSTPNAELVAENLSPEMRELLMSFGLLPGSKIDAQKGNQVIDFVPEKASVDPESYIGFKPLPEDSDSRKEMEDLLTRFGLLERNDRRQKSLNSVSNSSEQLNLDVVPHQFQSVLDDMGLVQRLGRKIREQPAERTTEKQHVFNPVESQHTNDEEMEKLGKLLNIMKKLEKLNGTVTQDDLKKINTNELREIISYLNENKNEKFLQLDQQRAPNPLNEDESIRKNEVKRQELSSTSTESTTSTESETTPIATTKSETPSIKDLEESFGGDSASSTTSETPETTTAARRSGFYYLLDWNSFFEIDDQKGKRVNLRFQPKVGDPKRFFSVTVP